MKDVRIMAKRLTLKTFDFFLDLIFPPSAFDKYIRVMSLSYAKARIGNTITVDIENIIKIPGVMSAIVVSSYENVFTRKLIWAMKFSGSRRAGKIIAELLYDELLEELPEFVIFRGFKKPILIPIPLSKKRLSQRGFNQTERIAELMQKIDKNKSFDYRKDILIKIKETPRQVSIKKRSERLKNLSGCFTTKNIKDIKGRDIILLDDVITTGSTVCEAVKVLKDIGAGKILVVAMAH